MRFLVFLGLLLWATFSSGQVYQWVDENGVRHFSDRQPPEGVEARETRPGGLSTYTAAPVLPTPAPAQRQQSPQQSVTVTPSSTPAAPRRNEQRCQSYLAQLEHIQEQLRRGYREPRGNRLRAQRREVSTRYRNECT